MVASVVWIAVAWSWFCSGSAGASSIMIVVYIKTPAVAPKMEDKKLTSLAAVPAVLNGECDAA